MILKLPLVMLLGAAIPAVGLSQSWELFDMSNAGFGSNTITDIAVDSQDNVWISTNWGLNRYDGSLWTNYLTSNSGLPDNAIYSLAVDSLDRIWMGTVFHGLVMFDGATWTQYDPDNSGLPDYEIKCVTIDHRGWVWCGTYLGLACFTGSEWRLYNDTPSSYGGLILNGPVIEDVAIREDGLVMIATLNGGFHYLTDTLVSVHATYIDFFPDNSQMGVTFDTIHDERWLATPSQGLLRQGGSWYGGPWFQYAVFNSGIPTDGLTCITMDEVGRPWMGSTNNGVIRRNINGSFVSYTVMNSGLPDNTIESLAFEHSGALWVGTFYGGAVRVDITLDTDDAKADQGLFVYPNPFDDRFELAYAVNDPTEWLMVDVAGRLVANGWLGPGNTHQLAPGIQQRGAYVLRIRTLEGWSVRNLIKH